MSTCVTDKPTFDSHRDLITSTEGDNISVTLMARGRPARMTYKWYKNNEPLYSTHGRQIRDAGLNITAVYRDDAGNYTCEASNTEGSSTVWFTLSVKRKRQTSIFIYPSGPFSLLRFANCRLSDPVCNPAANIFFLCDEEGIFKRPNPLYG